MVNMKSCASRDECSGFCQRKSGCLVPYEFSKAARQPYGILEAGA